MSRLTRYLCARGIHLSTYKVKATFNEARKCKLCENWCDLDKGERVEKEIEYRDKITAEIEYRALERKLHTGDDPDVA